MSHTRIRYAYRALILASYALWFNVFQDIGANISPEVQVLFLEMSLVDTGSVLFEFCSLTQKKMGKLQTHVYANR